MFLSCFFCLPPFSLHFLFFSALSFSCIFSFLFPSLSRTFFSGFFALLFFCFIFFLFRCLCLFFSSSFCLYFFFFFLTFICLSFALSDGLFMFYSSVVFAATVCFYFLLYCFSTFPTNISSSFFHFSSLQIFINFSCFNFLLPPLLDFFLLLLISFLQPSFVLCSIFSSLTYSSAFKLLLLQLLYTPLSQAHYGLNNNSSQVTIINYLNSNKILQNLFYTLLQTAVFAECPFYLLYTHSVAWRASKH